MFRQVAREFEVNTSGRGLYELTQSMTSWVTETEISTGLLNLFLRHTSASLLIQENADPEVQRDLERFLSRMVPDGDKLFRHTSEGPDDMPAHVRAVLTGVHLSIPVTTSQLALGTWQGIYLWEHRCQPHKRRIAAHIIGE